MNLVHEGVLTPDEPDFQDERREEEEARRKRETPADIASEMRECAEAADPAIWGDARIAGLVRKAKAQQIEYAKRIEEAAKRDDALLRSLLGFAAEDYYEDWATENFKQTVKSACERLGAEYCKNGRYLSIKLVFIKKKEYDNGKKH